MKELDRISRNIAGEMEAELSRIGILFRIFHRYKTLDSMNEKIVRKAYLNSGILMQDAIGVRINMYFADDLNIVIKVIKSKYNLVGEEIDKFNDETFKPSRTNIVFKIPPEYTDEFDEALLLYNSPIDKTFEVQIRTILSEGWHEVEHDLRYKCKKDWEAHKDLSRTLNGLYATLETGEWSMLNLFNSLSFRNYKQRSWEAMLRNKFRLRFKSQRLNEKIIHRLNDNNELAKKLFRINRDGFFERIIKSKLHIPLTYDNLIYILNFLYLRDHSFNRITPQTLREDFETSFNSEISVFPISID